MERRLLRRCLLIACIIAGHLIFVIGGCQQRKPQEKGRQPVSNQPSSPRVEARFKAARIIWHDEHGNRLFEARFDKAEASQEGQTAVVRLRNVSAQLYSGGKPASMLTAREVIADSRTEEVRASGGAKVVSISGNVSASAGRIVWKAQQDKLIGYDNVLLARDSLLVKAQSIVADTRLGKATLTGGAELSLSE